MYYNNIVYIRVYKSICTCTIILCDKNVHVLMN